jgi:hypothetical protein
VGVADNINTKHCAVDLDSWEVGTGAWSEVAFTVRHDGMWSQNFLASPVMKHTLESHIHVSGGCGVGHRTDKPFVISKCETGKIYCRYQG